MKVLTLEDLTKAAGGLASHFGKAAAHHTAKAAHHDTLHKAHSEMASFTKGKHDAMDDGDANKAYMAKAHEIHKAHADHHKALHELHKAHAEECDSMSKAFSADKIAGGAGAGAGTGTGVSKGAGTGTGDPVADPNNPNPNPQGEGASGDGVAAMIRETTSGLVKNALGMLNTDPAIQDEIRKMVLEGVRQALGDKVVPSHVRGVLDPPPGGSAARPVARPGQPLVEEKAPVELSAVFGE